MNFTAPAAALLSCPTSCKPELSNFLTRVQVLICCRRPVLDITSGVQRREDCSWKRAIAKSVALHEASAGKKILQEKGAGALLCFCRADSPESHTIPARRALSNPLQTQRSLTNWVVSLLTLYKTTRLLPRLLSQMITKFCLRRLTSSQPKHFLRAIEARVIKYISPSQIEEWMNDWKILSGRID